MVSEAEDWNKQDVHGDISALGREVCRAVAAAASVGGAALRVIAYPAEPEALAALTQGRVDVVAGVTPGNAAARGGVLTFGPAFFWDNQTFLVPRSLAAQGAASLAGRTVCFIDGTAEAGVLLGDMKARRIPIIPFPFQEEGEMEAALAGGHCQAISAYASKLAQARSQFHAMSATFTLLPDRLAIQPATIATRSDDPAWSELAATAVRQLGCPSRKQSRRRFATIAEYINLFNRTVGRLSAFGLDPGLTVFCMQAPGDCLNKPPESRKVPGGCSQGRVPEVRSQGPRQAVPCRSDDADTRCD